ncbi:MAG: hypothetical protein HUU38_09875 [Anaerolineales bacterium]|nr:hypothetical protein [Anaerolineales bacterium]
MTEELLEKYEAEIASLTLIPDEGGRFEFKVNGELLYSKLQTRRHANPGEIASLLADFLKRP